MRGIEFELPSSAISKYPGCYLTILLKNIPLDKNQVVVSDGIVYKQKEYFKLSDFIVEKQLHDILFSESLLLSAIFQFHSGNSVVSEINTYEDFLASNCNLMLIITDCYFIEIYFKDSGWLLTLLKNAENLGATSISVKTDITDGRNEMYV